MFLVIYEFKLYFKLGTMQECWTRRVLLRKMANKYNEVTNSTENVEALFYCNQYLILSTIKFIKYSIKKLYCKQQYLILSTTTFPKYSTKNLTLIIFYVKYLNY